MEKWKFVVTTSAKGEAEKEAEARALASALGAPYVPRNKMPMAHLKEVCGTDTVVLVTREGIEADTERGRCFFHLSMAQLRTQNIDRGTSDHMAEAMGLTEGMSVLDCTMGLASDAVVASYIVGAKGKVVGIEKSPVVHLIVSRGIEDFTSDDERLMQAVKRVQATEQDALDYLRKAEDGSFDVVYFDPMFRAPVHTSANFKPMRSIVETDAVSAEMVTEALRVARRRVVLKETRDSDEFARLGFTKRYGGKYSRIQYGVIEKEDYDG
ncbi:MAG: class I SAM-dependent methyltransferase [Selenomonadales bacterium]|nr:class I SAM-dependent methyltransferase [Selenomonadales bacterium]